MLSDYNNREYKHEAILILSCCCICNWGHFSLPLHPCLITQCNNNNNNEISQHGWRTLARSLACAHLCNLVSACIWRQALCRAHTLFTNARAHVKRRVWSGPLAWGPVDVDDAHCNCAGAVFLCAHSMAHYNVHWRPNNSFGCILHFPLPLRPVKQIFDSDWRRRHVIVLKRKCDICLSIHPQLRAQR